MYKVEFKNGNIAFYDFMFFDGEYFVFKNIFSREKIQFPFEEIQSVVLMGL